MRVGVVQFASGEDKVANLTRLSDLVTEAARDGADLVIAPEASMHSFGRGDENLAPAAEPLDGPFVTGLADLARSLGVTVVAGMFELVDGDPTKAYNTAVALSGSGDLVARYRKIHLFDALGWLESRQLVAGPLEPTTFPCGEFTVGLMTCYDLRFPELGRALVGAGATLLAVPSAWVAGTHKVEQWQALTAARAIESTAYVAAAGQPPPEYCGHSAVIDPYGVRLGELGVDDGVAVAEVTVEHLAEVRGRMPSLEHVRLR